MEGPVVQLRGDNELLAVGDVHDTNPAVPGPAVLARDRIRRPDEPHLVAGPRHRGRGEVGHAPAQNPVGVLFGLVGDVALEDVAAVMLRLGDRVLDRIGPRRRTPGPEPAG